MDEKEQKKPYDGLTKELKGAQGEVLSSFKAWRLAKKGRDKTIDIRTLEASLRSHKVEEKDWFRALGSTMEGTNLTWVRGHILISESSWETAKTLYDQEFKINGYAAPTRQDLMAARQLQGADCVGSQAA
jgi:hypothetical protein